MPTTFITNQLITPSCAIFLNGGSYAKNVMRDAMIVATDDTGNNYTIYYAGSYYIVPVDNVVKIISEGYIYHDHPVKDEWTNLAVNYDEYLN